MQSAHDSDSLSLPGGASEQRGLGETFSPDLYTGTGRYSVPLWFPRGPGGLQPSLALQYASTSGNGPFGLGWSLPTMILSRRTERGVPSYGDDDTLLLNGTELCRVGPGRYRRREEGTFERVIAVADGWEVTDRSGKKMLLGVTPAARIEDGDKIASWLIEEASDPRGNAIRYEWDRQDGHTVLAAILYGPWAVRFVYETRPDPFVDRRAGFAVRSTRRCTAVETHLFGDPDPVIRRHRFRYDSDAPGGVSLLTEVRFEGRRDGAMAEAPPLTLSYRRWQLDPELKPVRVLGAPLPGGLDEPGLELVDLEATGLPGVIQADGLTRRFWPNRGGGVLGPPRTLRDLPVQLDLGSQAVALADMDGTGTADLLDLRDGLVRVLTNHAGEGWQRARVAAPRAPSFDPAEPALRLVDLDGDGRIDVLRSSARGLHAYFNRGDGWTGPVEVPRVRDRRVFPDVSLADPRVKLACVTGDGLVDIAWVHGSRIDVWPSLGGGRFDARESLPVTPPLGDAIDPDRVFLVDIDGDGRADLIQVEDRRVRMWIQRDGGFVLAGEVRHTPDRTHAVRPVDLHGDGSVGLLWSRPPRRGDAGYRYLALRRGTPPNLLVGIDNGMGLGTTITYASAVQLARDAHEEGRPWQAHLPFPLAVVRTIAVEDRVSRIRTERRIAYRDGHFDGRTRELRGFREVEVVEAGDEHAPGARTVTRFHQGSTGAATIEARRVLRGRPEMVEAWALGDPAHPTLVRRERTTWAVAQVAATAAGEPIWFAHPEEIATETFESTDTPQRSEVHFTYDEHGNVVLERQRWDGDPGAERVSRFRYTADTQRWILNLPVEHEVRDGGGHLVSYRCCHYDGADFVGLPLGQVTHGLARRIDELVLEDAAVAAIHGGAPPDFATLGYVRMQIPGGETGWGRHRDRARHDARGNRVETRDALGHARTIEWDAAGLMIVGTVDARGHRFTGELDLRAVALRASTDPDGAITRYAFDPLGRVIAMHRPGDTSDRPTLRFEYLDDVVPRGRRIRRLTDAQLDSTVLEVTWVDGGGNSIQKRSTAEGGQVLVDGWRRHGARGLEVERSSPFFSASFGFDPDEGRDEPCKLTFWYDAMGRVVRVRAPDGLESRTVYSPGKIERHDVSGGPPRSAQLDAAGRVQIVTERDAGGVDIRTRYDRDARGEIASVIDGRGVTLTRHDRDLLGQILRITHVDAGVRSMVRDARGAVVSTRDDRGDAVVVEHDELGRTVAITGRGVARRLTWDAGAGEHLKGRLARVEDDVGSVELSYDARGCVVRRARTFDAQGGARTLVTRYAHDPLGRLRRLEPPAGPAIEYVYAERGFLREIAGVLTDVTRDARGQVVTRALANGVVERWDSDPRSFYVTRTRLEGPAGLLRDVTYAHDPLGSPTSMRDELAAATTTYSYDARRRLTAVDRAGTTTHFSYDEVGNFVRNESLAPEDLYLRPGTNQLAGVIQGGVEHELFRHDAAGNMVKTPGRDLEWDASGRLTRVTMATGEVVEYAWSFDGALARRRVHAPGQPVAETLFDDSAIVEHGEIRTPITRGRQVIAERLPDGTLRWFHADPLGSVVAVTAPDGSVLERRAYGAFGGATPAASLIERGFLGKYFDPITGLSCLGVRFYDPVIGRFLSVDPHYLANPGDAVGYPADLNPYAYAANNPLRNADPEGGFWQWIVGAAIIIAPWLATVAAVGGLLTVFTGGLVVSLGGVIGGAVAIVYFGVHHGWDDPDRWLWQAGDAFLVGVVVGAITAVTMALASAAYAGSWLSTAFGLGFEALTGISTEVGSIALGSGITGAIMGAGNGAITAYAEHGADLGAVISEMVQGGAIGFATGFAWSVFAGTAGALLTDAARNAAASSSSAIGLPNAVSKEGATALGNAVFKETLQKTLAGAVSHAAKETIKSTGFKLVGLGAGELWDHITSES